MMLPKIVLWHFFFAISAVVNRHFFNNKLSFDRTTAKNGIKSRKIAFQTVKKLSFFEYFSKNWLRKLVSRFMSFGAKRDPLHSWVFFRARIHSKSLYSVEKKIVGISQYAYFFFLPASARVTLMTH
jgi:hypothetical protein